jgi:hypothetical protein
MTRKIFFLLLSFLILMGCAIATDRHVQELVYYDGKIQRFSYYDEQHGRKGDPSSFMEAVDLLRMADPMALPELSDLPLPSVDRHRFARVKAYKGIIKNNTRYDVSVPSHNSQGIITVPARGWVEFIVWKPSFKFTAYRDGKPISCFSISVSPGEYDFMCDRYDFMAIIGVEEPVAVEGLG